MFLLARRMPNDTSKDLDLVRCFCGRSWQRTFVPVLSSLLLNFKNFKRYMKTSSELEDNLTRQSFWLRKSFEFNCSGRAGLDHEPNRCLGAPTKEERLCYINPCRACNMCIRSVVLKRVIRLVQ